MSSRQGKRAVKLVPRPKKVLAVRRWLNGESRVHVRMTTGVPESTLRGWCKNTELVQEARSLDEVPPAPAPVLQPVIAGSGPRSFPAGSDNKTNNNNNNNVVNLPGTSTSNGYSSGDELANRSCKLRTGSESDNDSGFVDLSDASNSNDSSIEKTERAPKRKRTQSESTDEDVPAKLLKPVDVGEENVTRSSEHRQDDDLEKREAKDLLYELFVTNKISRDVFIRLYEQLTYLEI